MMLLKYCTQYASNFGKLSSVHRAGKGQFSFQTQRKAIPKNVQILHNFTRLTLESNTQSSSSKALTVHKPRNSRCPSWI